MRSPNPASKATANPEVIRHESHLREARRPYVAPTLAALGRVADLTQGVTGNNWDGVSGKVGKN